MKFYTEDNYIVADDDKVLVSVVSGIDYGTVVALGYTRHSRNMLHLDEPVMETPDDYVEIYEYYTNAELDEAIAKRLAGETHSNPTVID